MMKATSINRWLETVAAEQNDRMIIIGKPSRQTGRELLEFDKVQKKNYDRFETVRMGSQSLHRPRTIFLRDQL